MTTWCCWPWCQRPRALTATELLVAASVNTAVRRISRANSDDSLENVSLRYNTFVVPPSQSPCPSRRFCSSPEHHTKRKGDKNIEMRALVMPLQRHQEQMKLHNQLEERATLKMANGDSCYDQSSSDPSEDSRSQSRCSGDDEEESTDGGATVVRMSDLHDSDLDNTTTGSTAENPLEECFGSVIVKTRMISDKMAGVLVQQLCGVPWVGAHEGLTVEVRSLHGHKSHYIFLPSARGPEVPVQREVSLKVPRSAVQSTEEGVAVAADGVAVLVTVWPGCGSRLRYCALGHSLTPVGEYRTARVMGLYSRTKPYQDLGCLEVSLISSSVSSSSTTRYRGLLIKILRAHGLKKPSFHWVAKQASKALPDKDRIDVWCSVTLWISGEKVKKEITPKVSMPLTCDPTFKSSCTFFVPKQEQHKACLVIKVQCGRGVQEVTIGRVVLGPFLYLGCLRHPPLLPVCSSSPRPVALSHWGRSLNTHYPVTAWHALTL